MTVGPLPRHCAEVVIRSAGGLRLGWRAGWGWSVAFTPKPYYEGRSAPPKNGKVGLIREVH
jgi:hypothetical protein